MWLHRFNEFEYLLYLLFMSLLNLQWIFIKPCECFVFCSAALIRGNRNNCTQFSRNLDWLVSKLERLESSSGIMRNTFFLGPLLKKYSKPLYLLTECQKNCSADAICSDNDKYSPSGILEVLHCILVESPEALNIIQRGHIKSIISLLYKHGRNHKVGRNMSAGCFRLMGFNSWCLYASNCMYSSRTNIF